MPVAKSDELSEQFPIVGIGASAGGINALKLFLKALPPKSGMAYVFIQHLNPEHVSVLPEILEKISPIPVVQITDKIHLEKDHLYIIPENKLVTAFDGVLRLEALPENHKRSDTIDIFFSSLGIVHQSFAIGVVLSGALNDGTRGLQVIKAYGGITFAQDEESSAFQSMPRNAVRAGAADFVLPPDKIAERLIEINSPFNHSVITDNHKQQEENDVFKQILTVLRVRKGVDFQYYKSSTLKRRILRRIALNKLEKPADYLYRLREDRGEQDALYGDMLISVTSFFRDTKTFNIICDDLLPALLQHKIKEGVLRVWVAGCATGEEAYSIAISINEQIGENASSLKIQIFATDISEAAIAKARNGIYKPSDIAGLSDEHLQQYFTKTENGYQVNKNIREMCIFAHHNLLKDPPFSKIDIVSCRNVLIYLEPVLQKKALTILNYSLNDNGFLILGKSETIGNNTDIFAPYQAAEKIYTRKGANRFMNTTTRGQEQSFKNIDKELQKETKSKNIYKLADEAMLAGFMPSGVLINERCDIIQFRGKTETWLTPPLGKPSFNVLKMARNGLAFELRNLLQQAKRTGAPVRKFNVFFKVNELLNYVNLHVIPLLQNDELHYLIVFQAASATGLQPMMFENTESTENINYSSTELQIEQLERELVQSRADMRIITEEQESANEELQAVNEELLSGNEELQSLNEELETSKEELQSTNEEIIVINKELVERNDQLNSARMYADAIVGTIRDPLLILDSKLKVKRATDNFYTQFKLSKKETEGRYLYELGNGLLNMPRLRKLLEGVLPQQKKLHDIEIERDFEDTGQRILHLNATQLDNYNSEPLILLSIEDITDKRKIEKGLAEVEGLLNESKDRLRLAMESAGLGTWDYNPSTQNLILDNRCREIFGFNKSTTVNYKKFLELIHPDDRNSTDTVIQKIINGDSVELIDAECRFIEINKKSKWIRITGKAYYDSKGVAVRLIGTILDITVQNLLIQATQELLKKKDEFISIASHELKTPITSLKASIQIVAYTIRDKKEFEPIYTFVQKASRQIDKLIVLVTNLLDVTKIQLGKLMLDRTEFILRDLLTECIDQISSKTYTFNIDCDPEIIIYADRNRIEQVIINILTNAIKYSPGTDIIAIKVTRSESACKVEIIDKGIGVEAEKMPFIFDRFFQAEANSMNYAGLGLGLFVSSEIIKQHGGKIGLDSVLGRGTEFWFTIPDKTTDQ